MAVKLAVTGAVAAAGGGTKAAVAGSSSSDSDVNDSDLDSDSEGEHEELRAVVDRMMKDESDEDDDGGGPAPRCARRSFFLRASKRLKFFYVLRTGFLTRAFSPPFQKHTTSGAVALGLPPAQPFDVVIEADDEVSECGKVASQIDDLLIIQVRCLYAAHVPIVRFPLRGTRSTAEKRKSVRRTGPFADFRNFFAPRQVRSICSVIICIVLYTDNKIAAR